MITTNEPSINESQPIVKLTTTAKSKKSIWCYFSKRRW